MPWVAHTFVLPWDVVWYWGCVAVPEKAASTDLAITAPLGTALAVAAVVDMHFLAASPLWWEKRLAAWRAAWQVAEEEIEVDDISIRVYTCSAAWVAALRDCILADGCSPGDSDCPARPSYSGGGD